MALPTEIDVQRLRRAQDLLTAANIRLVQNGSALKNFDVLVREFAPKGGDLFAAVAAEALYLLRTYTDAGALSAWDGTEGALPAAVPTVVTPVVERGRKEDGTWSGGEVTLARDQQGNLTLRQELFTGTGDIYPESAGWLEWSSLGGTDRRRFLERITSTQLATELATLTQYQQNSVSLGWDRFGRWSGTITVKNNDITLALDTYTAAPNDDEYPGDPERKLEDGTLYEAAVTMIRRERASLTKGAAQNDLSNILQWARTNSYVVKRYGTFETRLTTGLKLYWSYAVCRKTLEETWTAVVNA